MNLTNSLTSEWASNNLIALISVYVHGTMYKNIYAILILITV